MLEKKILIIEDDHVIGMEIKDRLETLGYNVLTRLSYGEDAIEQAGDLHPDLILMDIQLAGEIDGIQAADKIKDLYDIPVVYLTAYADDNTLERAKITEPFGYVLKPFEERELVSTIEMALYKHVIEQKLKNNERWLATTLKSIGDGVIATDTEGRIIFMNPIAEQLTGWEQDQAMDKSLENIFCVIDEETKTPLKNSTDKIIHRGTIERIPAETILLSKDGVEIPILETVSPIKDELGENTGAVLVFQDNTERKKAQRKLALQNRNNQLRADLWKLASDKTLLEEELIKKMLDHVGPVLNVSRVSYNKLIGNYLEDGKYKCIIEWCKKGTKSTLGVTLPAKIVNYFVKEKITVVNRESALERIPTAFRSVAKPAIISFEKLNNIESILIVPFRIKNELIGILSFDICKDQKKKPEWTDELKSIVLEATDIVATYITQKRTQDDLRISEERFKTIFQTIPDSVFIKDRHSTYTHVNPAMEKRYNKSFNEMEGFTDEEIFGEKIGQQNRRTDLKVLNGEIVKEEYSEQVEGGETIFDVVEVPMRNQQGEITGLCGIARDITERKKVEMIQQVLYEISNAVNITKNLFELFKSIQSYLGKVVDTSNFFIAMYEKDNDSISLPYHIDEKDKFKTFPVGKTLTRYVIKNKKSYLVKTEGVKKLAKNGEIEIIGNIPKVWLGVPLKSGAEVIGVMVVQSYTNSSLYTNEHLEILELISGQIALAIDRKRAEEERVRLATAIENAAEGVLIMDEKGSIQYANPAFETITGYSLEESKGKISRILKSGKKGAKYNKEIWDKISNGEIWNGYISSKKKNNSSYEEEITISPIRDEGGKIINYVAIRRDVTEQKRLADQLRQSQKMEAIGTLAGGIAHDFNNIIGAISGYTELTMDDVTNENSLRNLQQVLKASHRAKDLVQQILAFSRLTEQEWKPLQICSIVKETLKLLRASLPATIEIRQDIQSNSSLILADPIQIHSLMMNLSTNAHHAMLEKDGILEVTLKEVEIGAEMALLHQELAPGKYIRLSVSDTGTGINPEIMDRIFDPYFTTKEVGEGSGMGLALVHGIVKNHHGEITVESELGKGTIFSVFLPVIQKEVKDKTKKVGNIPGGDETILYVDDEKNLVRVSKQRLERLGYTVVGTMDSIEALKIFTKDPDYFDLIITDQTMPKMTGAELAQKVLKIRPDIPIILSTGYSELISKEKSKAMGISEFIMKPLFAEEIATLIRSVLDKNNRSEE
ncbi:PAS domain S-box protein [candidate division KSB1 bacterium]|nr:PAS domain S-box protein [candidate division KSB1 bacterium]